MLHVKRWLITCNYTSLFSRAWRYCVVYSFGSRCRCPCAKKVLLE
uniref:Uncharacterized protein n=1 Tax=Arundo donax TaxID=35708 RepID=A0A0A9A7S8_ARUDO